MEESIKTYKDVNRDNGLNFRIQRMEDIYAERNGQVDKPHRHDYYTVLVVKKATGKHIIDFNEYSFSTNQVFFVSPGQIHQVIEEQQSSGYVILFSTQFLIENNIPFHFIDDLNLFNDHGHSPPLPINEAELVLLSGFCEEMIKIQASDLKYKEQAISSYIKLLLIHGNNVCTLKSKDPQNQEAVNSILKNFKNLVDKKYSEWHQTSDYAAELSVTPDYLNRVVKSLTGKTAKEFIQSRIIIEAKRLIAFSGLTSKEIGYELGFSEPANFSAFFKKETGIPPSQFNKIP
ncbi:helix-turn-helix domain-containing protein [Maribellus comscasis]|uniref:Helix-turn-helix domain-containing protein n=2 Tax=Maribellus comscasis TaxID=2681766 RepID=A0A6I6K3S6_9BACT|nr:helix-turn-helix domain-containing protein [Maribellus comscasis]